MSKFKVVTTTIIAFFVILCSANISAQNEILKIATLSGKVLVKIHPSTEWIEAKVGQSIHQKDSIKTQEDGKAALEFPNKSSLTLKPNTEISVEELIWDNVAKKVNINMTTGELKTMIKKLDTPSEFEIKTPTAICGARGTIFYVVVFADGTGVYVEEGLVDLLNTISGESYTIYEGRSSEAGSDGATTEPRELTKDEVDKYISGYDLTVVAEPYVEPAAGARTPDIAAPETTPENTASQT